MKNQGRHIATATILTIIATVVVYFAVEAMFPIMTIASAEGAATAPMFTAHYWVISFLFSLIVVFMLYSIVVFRQKEGEDEDGYYTHGNFALEVGWTIAPIGIVLVFAFWGTNLLIDMTSNEKDAEAWVVNVRGFKWGWAFNYPDLADHEDPEIAALATAEINALVVPKDRPVVLNLISDDIIHSFWVPEFHVKQDLLPGDVKQLRFTPIMTTEEIIESHTEARGDVSYFPQVRCAEICGTSHAYMLADVWSMSNNDATAQKILDLSKLPSGPVERGAFYYENLGCNQCHSLDGSLDGYSGPTWLGIIGREEALEGGSSVIVDQAYIESSIYDPNGQIVEGYAAGVMPQNFEQQFAELTAQYAASGIEVDIIAELIAFMETLGE